MPFVMLQQGYIGLGDSKTPSHIALTPALSFASNLKFFSGHIPSFLILLDAGHKHYDLFIITRQVIIYSI
jgi:hypothetical protein